MELKARSAQLFRVVERGGALKTRFEIEGCYCTYPIAAQVMHLPVSLRIMLAASRA